MGEPYAQALLADTTLAIALPMWIVALVTVVVSHALFPDETDFRTLTPLPIGQPLIFGAKLIALALFGGLCILTAHVAITPLVIRISFSRWTVDAPPLAILAFWAASLLGSAFTVLAIATVTGMLITCTPTRRVHELSVVVRTAMVGALMLALPLVMALPTQSVRLARHSPVLFIAPPAWFMGVERVLLGHRDPYFVRLAQIALVFTISAAGLTFVSYVVLYRRFDRVMLHALAISKRGERWRDRRWPWRTVSAGDASLAFDERSRQHRPVDDPSAATRSHPVRAAVRDFTWATLRRSALHQGVLVGLSTCGIALGLNGLVRAGLPSWIHGLDVPPRQIVVALASLPFPLMALLGVAARASLALPIEPRANWVFRMAEGESIRADALRAAERVIVLFAAAIPAALTLPVQWIVVGPRALVAAALTMVIGLLWAEALLRGWRRIPFTCSYLPGKHSVAQSSLVGVGTYVLVSLIGGGMEMASLRGASPVPTLVIIGVFALIVLVLRRDRRRKWRETPLMFDDELPSDVQVFRLSGV
jgi:hypothetical protein